MMTRLRITAACFGLLLSASSALAQVDTYLVWEDARVIRRVATLAGKSMPKDLLLKLANGTVDTLRGKQPGGAYLFAHYQREEAGVRRDNFSIKVRKADTTPPPFELRGTMAYRVVIQAPSRRYLVARNRGVHLETLTVAYTNEAGEAKTDQFQLGLELAPGERTTLDLKEIARNPVARLVAWTDPKQGGSGSIDLILSEPKLVDDARSPYYETVQIAHQLVTAVGKSDPLEIRKLCDAMTASVERLAPGVARAREDLAAASAPNVAVTPSPAGRESWERSDFYRELQIIEDLLTGSESERREGMDKLHQLIRSIRP